MGCVQILWTVTLQLCATGTGKKVTWQWVHPASSTQLLLGQQHLCIPQAAPSPFPAWQRGSGVVLVLSELQAAQSMTGSVSWPEEGKCYCTV